MLDHIINLPLDLLRKSRLILPRFLFIKTYTISVEAERRREEDIRNTIRRAAYELKKNA